MAIRPPSRRLVSEIVIAALIYVGTVASTMLASLFLTAVPLILMRNGDEGAIFSLPAISSCIALLIGPIVFASIVANHCRRVPPFFVALMPTLWLMQLAYWRRHHLISNVESLAIGMSAVTGLALGYWTLQRKVRAFQPEAKPHR